VGVLPENRLYYYFQSDHSLGECVYAVNFWQTESEVAMRAINFDPIKFGMVTAVKKDNIVISIVVTDVETDFAVYILMQSTMLSVPFVEQRMQKSFDARIEAVYNWIITKYTGGKK
jgi:uncharacterized membrane protein YwzB